MTSSLASLPEGYRAVVAGATGGIGAALLARLKSDPRCAEAVGLSRRSDPPLDAARPETVEAAMDRAAAGGPLHLVIVATGVLHGPDLSPEKSWRHLDAGAMEQVFRVNTVLPALIAKHALDRLAKGEKAVFAALSARVGSISDNRLGGWHAYRASKAALNQILRTCAIELARKNPSALCIGLHPGTVDTGLSEPFQGNVPDGKLFTPDHSAARLLAVIDALGAEASGGVYDWAGERVGA
ncbi:SDR family NAD(P)-dependent oxidoreductase [Glycocaulis profundi]|nr:SDR family NAD(P)-dependent oxidoreductase [Glycocaulis profundi]